MKKITIVFFIFLIFGCSEEWVGGTANDSPRSDSCSTIDDCLQRAKSGDAEAQYQLGILLIKDGQVDSGLSWGKTAAKRGHIQANRDLGRLYAKDDLEFLAYEYLERAASLGDPLSQYWLGLFCQWKNMKDITIDCTPSSSEKWILKSAKQGYPEALSYQAMYLASTDEERFSLKMRAAEGGDQASMAAIGASFHAGIGVKQDCVEGYAWALAAKEFGEVGDELNIDHINRSLELTGSDISESQKRMAIKRSEEILASIERYTWEG